LELAAKFQATEYSLITASLGLIDADWDNGVSVEVIGSNIDLSGTDTSNVVTESWNLGFNYSRPLANGYDFIAAMQISYRGEQDGGAP
jgi:iron complex outermembrane receptor protein